MPLYLYTGPAGMHPRHRDALNVPVGYTEPGDTRDLDKPLGPHWVLLEGNEELRELLLAQRKAEAETAEAEQQFADDMAALRRAGLSTAQLEQLAGLGAGAGDPIAQALMAGSKGAIAELNALATQLLAARGGEEKAPAAPAAAPGRRSPSAPARPAPSGTSTAGTETAAKTPEESQ
jgi:hypothetical protein